MRRIDFVVLALVALFAAPVAAVPAEAQNRDILREMQQRALEERERERLARFIEDTYEFFELSGELVSFRVHPEMTPEELDAIADRSRDLDDQAGRLISYVRSVAPYVRGRTDGLWIVVDPLDEESTLEQRLTLILALVNRMQPKFDQMVEILSEVIEPTVPVEELQLETSAPFLIVSGLEELRLMTRDLRRAL